MNRPAFRGVKPPRNPIITGVDLLPRTDPKTVLRINDISVSFDGFYALTDVDVEVKRHTVHFFIGPNGAGKTTLLDIICAKTKPTAGTVTFYPVGREVVRLTGMKEHAIVREGIGRKFQVPSVFVNLTVLENMVLSLKGHKGIWDSIFHRVSEDEREQIDTVLQKVDLRDRREIKAGSLAHGEKQWLEIAMQLVQKPELIMLDEPAAGMGKAETEKTGEILKEIKRECTVIVVEHDMEFVKQAADTVTVLHEGKVLTQGNIHDVLADKTVQAVYLGRGGER
jgi:urea transport system ATP-binding protein